VEHVGLVLAGVATVAFDDRVIEMHPGHLFYVPRSRMTAGLWGLSPTCRSTSLGRTNTAGEGSRRNLPLNF
jgi:hypothetical protein